MCQFAMVSILTISACSLQDDLNGIFGGSLLLSLLTTSGVFCTVAVYTQLQGLNLEGITYVVFMMTATSQVYLVCYYGELVRILVPITGRIFEII